MAEKREEYELLFNTINYLVKNKKVKEEIFTVCEKALNIEPMKVNNVKQILSKVISIGEYVIRLDNDIILSFEKIPYFLAHFEALKEMEVEDILIKLEQYAIKCTNIDELIRHYIYILSMLLALDYKKNNYEEQYYISHFLYSILNYKNNIDIIQNINDLTLDEFKSISLDSICDNEYLLNLYNLNDIKTINDLINTHLAYLMIFINYDEIKVHKLLEIYSKAKKERLSEEFKNILLKLTPREEKCFRFKYGIDDGNFKTLENIGSIFKVTRERIRQILNSCENRLYKILQPEYLYFKYLYEMFKKDHKYFFCDKNIEYFEDDFSRRMFLVVLDLLQICNVKYNSNIAFDFDITYDEIIDDVLASKPRFISVEDFDKELEPVQNILIQGYNFNGMVYARKGRNLSRVMAEVIDQYLNRTVDLKSNDFDKIKEKFKTDYYMDIMSMSEHGFKSTINRIGYGPVGKSVFKHKDDFVLIPNDLFVEIVSYLNEINSPILYSVLYKHFDEKLMAIGIDNHEYFKTIIDLKISDDFNISKSYITPKNSTKSAVEFAISTLRSFDGVFDIRDVKDKLPHYSNISLDIFISKELDNGLVPLFNKNYIYFDNIKIAPEVIKKLKEVIDKLLINNNGITSAKNVYLDIYYNDEKVLKELGEFGKSFSLFSLCKELFKKDYNFKRPLIFNKNIKTMSVYELIIKKLANKKIITNDDIKNENLNLGTTLTGYNRIQISELLSDSFMMIDENKYINREFYQIDQSTLSDIKVMLNLLLKRENEIDTRKFKGYGLLPRFKFSWNKYLLLGIIHCYFTEEYEIINQSDSRSLEFIVRRLKHE